MRNKASVAWCPSWTPAGAAPAANGSTIFEVLLCLVAEGHMEYAHWLFKGFQSHSNTTTAAVTRRPHIGSDEQQVAVRA